MGRVAHTSGFDKYEDISKAEKKLKENWGKVSHSDKYSTGLPLLDRYLGGGYGLEGAGEVMLIHSTSKTFKSTLSMQLMRTPLEQGVKVGWIVLEGGLWRGLRNLRQLYAPVEEDGRVQGYERYDALSDARAKQIFAMTEEMQLGGFSMDEVIAWMQKTRALHGVELFLIDPIGYLSDYSSDWNVPDYKKESKFMKDLVHFADSTASTVVCLQHNTKGNENSLNQSHREAAIGGSQSFSKSPTKVVEMRNEGWLDDNPRKGRLISFEMYMARDVPDWRGMPVLLAVNFHQDQKGKYFSMRHYSEGEAEVILTRTKDSRKLWFGQLNGDLESLQEEA